ncbi:MAG TPA: metalloregulator ArsR/SmtB family transcription factor [Vicinamibacteria bacterium]|nr:metalloregulator ArsR/SmtB family transcription factor [Vicinamibacteria bacterium]
MRGARPPLREEALRLVAARFRVLGHPLRLRLLQALERGERTVSALAAETGATQPNVSKHLRLLEESGLVRRRQEGMNVMCAVADESVLELCDVVCHSVRGRLAVQAGLFERGARVAVRRTRTRAALRR